MSYPATARADELLTFISGFTRQNNGLAPSFDEMRGALALSSKSAVHRLLVQLEERGAIRRVKNRSRCIELVRPRAITLPPELFVAAQASARRSNRSVNALVADAVRCWLDTD